LRYLFSCDFFRGDFSFLGLGGLGAAAGGGALTVSLTTFFAAFLTTFFATFFAAFLMVFFAVFFTVFFAAFLTTFLTAFFAAFLTVFFAAFLTVFFAAFSRFFWRLFSRSSSRPFLSWCVMTSFWIFFFPQPHPYLVVGAVKADCSDRSCTGGKV
jgi:hypothetical protein